MLQKLAEEPQELLNDVSELIFTLVLPVLLNGPEVHQRNVPMDVIHPLPSINVIIVLLLAVNSVLHHRCATIPPVVFLMVRMVFVNREQKVVPRTIVELVLPMNVVGHMVVI